MIFGRLNPEKIWHEYLTYLSNYLSDVATLPWEIKKNIFTVLFIHGRFLAHSVYRQI